MSYYLTNTNVPININMSTIFGVGVTGLSQSNVNIKLIRSGITILNGITGDYTFAEQHNGIYRIVLGTTLTTIADTDYVLIATDLTAQALDDKLEFTLYAESVDSSYTKLKSEIDANEAILNTINTNTDNVESLLTNATYGLSAIKTKEDDIATQLSTTRTDILNEVISQVNANEIKIDTLTFNLSNAEANILSEVNAIPTNTLLTNDSRLDGLINLDTTVSSRSSSTQVANVETSILNEVTSQVNQNETKIDTIITNLSNTENNIIAEVNAIPTNPLLTNDSRLDNLINLDAPVSNTSTTTQVSAVETNVLNEVISRDRLTEINNLSTQLSNSENTIVAEVNAIPTNPLTDNDPILVNIDTPISTRSSLTDQQVWSYSSRQLTGVSGVNQINVNDFMSQFIVNEALYLTVDMIDTNTVPVTGLTYSGPGSGTIDIILYKNGIKQTLSTLTVGVTGLEEGLYRVFLDKTLMDTPKVDYVLIAKDLTSNAVTYKMQFSLYDVVGLEGAYQANILIKDYNTNLLVPDVNVYIKDSNQVLLINKGYTNSSGEYITGLGAGDYKIILKKAFTDFTVPESMTVSSSGSNTFTFWGSGFSPSTPVTSGSCVVYGYVYDMSGNAVKNATITVTDTLSNRYTNSGKIVKVSKTVTTDSLGYFEIELVWHSQLEPSEVPFKMTLKYSGMEYSKNIIVPPVSSVNFLSL